MKVKISAGLITLCVCVLSNHNVLGATQVYTLPLENRFQTVVIPSTLGVIVNLDDPNSVAFGKRYAEIRDIPTKNIVGLNLKLQNSIPKEYLRRELEKLYNHDGYKDFAGFALTFDKPYKVGLHQSITAAVTQGIENLQWTGPCNETVKNPDARRRAGAQLSTKPSMLVSGGQDFPSDVDLAERGKSADMSDPQGDVFFLKTSDITRSEPRDAKMIEAFVKYQSEIGIELHVSDSLENSHGIFGFQLGTFKVKNLETLEFLPGGYADHLTSSGGMLYDKREQTTVLELIRAGATGSYGAVREPCNFAGKFPDPERMLGSYLHGDTLLEAYWKSISMTTEGLLVGEPLARPFPVIDAQIIDGKQLVLKINRHTLAFLAESKTASTSIDGAIRIAIYDVSSGTRDRIGEALIPSTSKVSDVVGVFDVAPDRLGGLILGVLPL